MPKNTNNISSLRRGGAFLIDWYVGGVIASFPIITIFHYIGKTYVSFK